MAALTQRVEELVRHRTTLTDRPYTLPVKDSRVCHACGRANPDDARFCSACGSMLAGEAAPREARKVVTSLFADVVGSTTLGERLDPEDLQEVIGEGVARVVRTVEELGGHVDRVAGDGALVLFGAPVAHEDDADRAVLAGVRILDAIEVYAGELTEQRGLAGFAVRVGVETGVAVLAPLGGARPIEFGATGDVLNTAARLEAAAEPGTMLVGPRTFALTEAGFDWDAPVELRLKGKAEVVVAHRPRRARSPGARPLSRGAQTELVGRERELEAVRRALDELLSGSGSALVVSGEAGFGKTRLLVELRRRAERSGSPGRAPLWLEGRCVSYGERLPYFPFQVLLRDWLGAAPEQSEAEVGALLDVRLHTLFAERAADLRPFLGSLLGLAPRADDSRRLAGLQPGDVQRLAFDSLRELIDRLAQAAPVILALDDLHWADTTSIALVEHLLASTADAPVLLILAARPDRGHPSWTMRARAARELGARARSLELVALADGTDRELLRALLRGAELPAELQRTVLDRAEGNPLYLEELVRALIDAEALVPRDGGLHFEREVEVKVPHTVEKLVLARVDVLSPPARELLSAASVLGRRFTRPLLEAVAGDVSALGELREAELVREGRPWAGEEYRFHHHLIQETTYGSLLKRRRQQLHRRAAEAFEAALGEQLEARLGLLAHHWGAAGEHERALAYHARAGEAAWRIAATHEALDHYDAALISGAELGLTAADERFRELLLERGRLRSFTDRGLEGAADIASALEGARATGDQHAEMNALSLLAWFRHGGYPHAIGMGERALGIARSLGDERAQVRALARLAILDANRLRLDRAVAEGSEALEIARRGDDQEVLGWALDSFKLAQLKLGNLAAVERICAELIEIKRRAKDPIFLKFALLESTFPLLGKGDLDAALARADEALALNRKVGDRNNQPLFLDALCWVRRSRGDYARALEVGRRANALAAEVEAGEWQGWTAATLAWVLLDLRAAEVAVPLLEAGASAARSKAATGEVLRCTGLLAWARWLGAEHEQALGLAEEAERMLGEVVAPRGSAWLFGSHSQLALARVRLDAGEPDRAAALARRLYEAAESAGWRDVAADAAIVLALCEEAGDRTEAAGNLFERALGAPGKSASAWEARLGLARLGGEGAERHAADARVLIERVLTTLGDDPAAAGLAAAPAPARVR